VAETPDAPGYLWSYRGMGATITGTGNSVTISFGPEATSGNLAVYGSNSCGNGAVSPAFPVTVDPLPGPAGTISGTSSLCQGEGDVAYSVAAVTDATDYVWSYSGTGALITGSGASITVIFSTLATSGNLTVYGTNDCGDGAVSPPFPITVNTLPAAPVSGGDHEICANQPVPALTVTVGAGETADWYSGATGGTPLASGTLSYTPAGAGTFYVEARNVTTGCLSLTRTAVSLTIHPLPAAYAGADQFIPNGTSTTIGDATASGTAPLIYSWTPASAFVDPGILHPTTVNLFLTGNYTLTVTDGNTCVKSDQMTITITGGVLGVNPSAEPDALCAGEGAQLFANASGGSGTYSYNWISDPVGFTSEEANPLVSPTVSTTYTVVVFDDYNVVNGQVTVTAYPRPVVFAGADRSIPFGKSTTIGDATAAGTAPLNYVWTPAATFVDPSLLNPTTVNLTSAQTCVLTVTDANGCTQSDVMTINVTGSPLDADPAASPDLVCAGGSTQLTANASGGSGTYTYSWTSDPPGFTTALANPQVTPDVTTTYTVVVDDGYNIVTGSITVTVILLEVTCPDDMEALLTDPPFALTGGLPAGGVYSGNGVTEGWFDPSTAGNGEHIITYAYEDENGCTDLCTFLITVSGSALSGDANCDGIVNVLDIITIVNYIMGQNPSPFCFDEADTNDDLMINVLDIIGTVNIIMGQ
ncbi:MAG: dockerin type I domain-containing protein, partial [Bacteroidales bacterium]|nr:dockerin type I domain-containing protein [Bacteroidales bacterium]